MVWCAGALLRFTDCAITAVPHVCVRAVPQYDSDTISSSLKAVRAFSVLTVLVLVALTATQVLTFLKVLKAVTPRLSVLVGLGLGFVGALLSFAGAGVFGDKIYLGSPTKYVAGQGRGRGLEGRRGLGGGGWGGNLHRAVPLAAG
jgi:hypothetical protein